VYQLPHSCLPLLFEGFAPIWLGTVLSSRLLGVDAFIYCIDVSLYRLTCCRLLFWFCCASVRAVFEYYSRMVLLADLALCLWSVCMRSVYLHIYFCALSSAFVSDNARAVLSFK